MTIAELKAAVAQAAMELEQATREHDAAKARHRAALVSGGPIDRAALERANTALLESRDKYDLAVMELQSEEQAAIKKAAQGHIRALQTRITKTLAHYPLEEIA